MTFDFEQRMRHAGYTYPRKHSHQFWFFYNFLFLSYATDRKTDRRDAKCGPLGRPYTYERNTITKHNINPKHK